MTGSELFLVRHGETEWSRTGRHTGRTDVALTDLGRRQADALGVALAGRTFAAALVSPLGRATETFDRSGVDAVTVRASDDLIEWDYGVYEGRTTPEIRETDPGWTVWHGPLPDGESAVEVGRRADRVIGAALAEDGDVVIFGHGHLLRVLAARWLSLDPAFGGHLALATATVSTLGFERETRAILGWNHACHLTALPTSPAASAGPPRAMRR